MMLPARTCSPPNFFTPRRLLSLSRPLRDEPPAFLCAMSNYFAFGLFLAAALAGAAFFVDGVLAAALGAAFLPDAFLAAGSLPLAALSSSGAGFGVGSPATSFERCWSLSTSVFSSLVSAGFCSALPLGAFSGTGAVGVV